MDKVQEIADQFATLTAKEKAALARILGKDRDFADDIAAHSHLKGVMDSVARSHGKLAAWATESLRKWADAEKRLSEQKRGCGFVIVPDEECDHHVAKFLEKAKKETEENQLLREELAKFRTPRKKDINVALEADVIRLHKEGITAPLEMWNLLKQNALYVELSNNKVRVTKCRLKQAGRLD